MISYGAEAFIFGYLGLTFFAHFNFDWSLQLIVAEIIIVTSGRFMGTIGLFKLIDLFGYNSGVSFRELLFVSYAGMIRGAVAFALVLRIDDDV